MAIKTCPTIYFDYFTAAFYNAMEAKYQFSVLDAFIILYLKLHNYYDQETIITTQSLRSPLRSCIEVHI